MATIDNIREVILHSKEIKKDKQSFIVNSAEINGKWYKIKFTKSCHDVPRTKGLYRLHIDFDDCSLELGKTVTNKAGKKFVENDTIWVRHVVGLEAFTDEEIKARNREALSKVFGG